MGNMIVKAGGGALKCGLAAKKRSFRDLPPAIRFRRTFSSSKIQQQICQRLETHKPLLLPFIQHFFDDGLFSQAINCDSIRRLGDALKPTQQRLVEAGRHVDLVCRHLEQCIKQDKLYSFARIVKAGNYSRDTCICHVDVQLVLFMSDIEPPYGSDTLRSIEKYLCKENRQLSVTSTKCSTASAASNCASSVSATVNNAIEVEILPAPNYGTGQIQLNKCLSIMATSERPHIYLPGVAEHAIQFMTSQHKLLNQNEWAMIRVCKLWNMFHGVLANWTIDCLTLYVALAFRQSCQNVLELLQQFFSLLYSIAQRMLCGGFADGASAVPYPPGVFWNQSPAESEAPTADCSPQQNQVTANAVEDASDNSRRSDATKNRGKQQLKLCGILESLSAYVSSSSASHCTKPDSHAPADVSTKKVQNRKNNAGPKSFAKLGEDHDKIKLAKQAKRGELYLNLRRGSTKGKKTMLDPVSPNVDLMELVPRETWRIVERLSLWSLTVVKNSHKHILLHLFAM